MPYTPSHAIAAAPLWYLSRKRLPLSALIVGSLSPDFPYMLYLAPTHAPGHSLAGIFAHCLPQSLAVLAVWILLVEAPTLQLLGLPLPKRDLSIKTVLLAASAVILGAATHVCWDSVTHSGGWLVEELPVLRAEILALPLYRWAQYSSGLLGLVATAIWYLRSSPFSQVARPQGSQIRSAVFVFAASTLLVTSTALWLTGLESIPEAVVAAAAGGFSGVCIGAIAYAAIHRLERWS